MPDPASAKSRSRHRGIQAALVVALVPLCWLGMQIVHEAGHVIATWLTGGTVTAVVLHPLAISRTNVAPNPQPLVVVWGGPIIGVALPTLTWLLIAKVRLRSVPLWRFFAGFCLVANGVYIGYGVIEPVGDASDMLRHGTPPWMLATFGLATVPAGLALWHGQGKSFGFAPDVNLISRRDLWLTLVSLILVVGVELIWTGITGFR